MALELTSGSASASVGVSTVKIRATISIVAIQPSVSSELVTAQTTYQLSNATEIWTDPDSKNRMIRDEVTLSEVHFSVISKITADSAAISDNDVLHVGLHKEDFATFEDSDYKDVIKALVSIGITSEEQRVDFFKTLVNDTPFTSDIQKQTFNKFSVDSYTTADSDFKDFYKALVDSSHFTDTLDTIEFFKNTQDDAGLTDDETIAFAKSLFDVVGVTDDIDGAASILDDQEMDYFKHTTDIANITDLFIRVVAFVRVYSDLVGVTDKLVWDSTKALTDTSAFTDIQRQDFGKLQVDLPVVSDALAIQLLLAPFADNTFVVDIATMNTGKNFTQEEASLADTGSLRSQGYADFSYFAEDYVGASRTF